MKCCHLLAALVLAACGLDTGALPAKDAGVDADASARGIAGSPATWPTRRRLTPLAKDAANQVPKDKDAGAADPNNPSNKPGGKPPSTGGQGGQVQPSPGSSAANPGGTTSNPNGQAAPGGSQTPSTSNGGKGGQAKPSGQAGPGTSQPSGGTPSADAGMGTPSQPGSSASGGNNSPGGSNNGGQKPGSNGSSGNGNSGNGGQGPTSGPGSKGNSNPVDNTISGIVDLVLAILDLSLGPVRPVEIEQLVSAILVLSLAPAELAAESLIAVLDALDGTHICRDDPDRCNPLCENLESDCSVCGHDEDCIDRVEEMCHVKLPRRCH